MRTSIAFQPSSRCQTAHLVPAAHFCARGLRLCFAHPNRGVGGAPRDVRVRARHPWGVPSARHKTRVNALMTQHARRLARRLASHNAGRSPLGAPPWRFWASGPRFLFRHPPPLTLRRAWIRAASSSQPGRSAWRATSRASRGEQLRAARRKTPRPAPPSGSSPEPPLDERGCERYMSASICSQVLSSTCSQILASVLTNAI